MKHGSAVPEPSVAPGEDPRGYARLMSAVWDATMAGTQAPARPRPVIWDSWQRMIKKGLRPDRRTPPVAETDTVERMRHESGLTFVVDEISRALSSLTANGEQILALGDAQGRVLWRSGSRQVLARADNLGFVEGALWTEATVGTNALGTALISQRAVQTFSAEHYNRSQHPFTCSGAPIRDPRTGRVLGAIDVTGPAATVHPTTVALIDAVARLAESRLRELRDHALNRLRTFAAPILARMSTPACAVDTDGWVVAVDSMPLQDRILLPPDIAPGQIWLPSLGMCSIETLPGGWLVRLMEGETDSEVARVSLDLRNSAAPVLEMHGQFGRWQHDISLRHAEILLILAARPCGRSAPELAADLYGDPTRVGAIRVEMSRLRKQFAGLVTNRPYRFAESSIVTVHYPADRSELLAPSIAPTIRALRLLGETFEL